jgi:hypothetical protein
MWSNGSYDINSNPTLVKMMIENAKIALKKLYRYTVAANQQYGDKWTGVLNII